MLPASQRSRIEVQEGQCDVNSKGFDPPFHAVIGSPQLHDPAPDGTSTQPFLNRDELQSRIEGHGLQTAHSFGVAIPNGRKGPDRRPVSGIDRLAVRLHSTARLSFSLSIIVSIRAV